MLTYLECVYLMISKNFQAQVDITCCTQQQKQQQKQQQQQQQPHASY